MRLDNQSGKLQNVCSVISNVSLAGSTRIHFDFILKEIINVNEGTFGMIVANTIWQFNYIDVH